MDIKIKITGTEEVLMLLSRAEATVNDTKYVIFMGCCVEPVCLGIKRGRIVTLNVFKVNQNIPTKELVLSYDKGVWEKRTKNANVKALLAAILEKYN